MSSEIPSTGRTAAVRLVATASRVTLQSGRRAITTSPGVRNQPRVRRFGSWAALGRISSTIGLPFTNRQTNAAG
jgi:hypothetical protein